MDILELSVVRRELEKEFPTFITVPKAESWFMQTLGFLLKVLTFGKMTAFMTSFTTTVGYTVYTPKNWETYSPLSQAVTLRHERVHMRQAKKYTRVLFGLLYLLVFLPVGLAWYRAKFEMEAYSESLRAYREYGVDITGPALRESIIGQFTSGNYAWMWPFRGYVERWYDETVREVLRTVSVRSNV
jgi:hypothetical protein